MIPGEQTRVAEDVWLRDPVWHAPSLWVSEFCNILALYLRRGNLDLESVMPLVTLAEARFGEGEAVASTDVLTLAATSGCTAYDCEFVALARKLEAPLLTFDQQLLAAFPRIAMHPEDWLAREEET